MVTERTQIDQANLQKFMTPLHPGYNDYMAKAEATLRTLGRTADTVQTAAMGQLYQTYMKTGGDFSLCERLHVCLGHCFFGRPVLFCDLEKDGFGRRRWRSLG